MIDLEKIKFLCKKNKKNFKELCADLELHRNTIWTWSKETTRVNNILLLTDYFGCQISDIIAKEDGNER